VQREYEIGAMIDGLVDEGTEGVDRRTIAVGGTVSGVEDELEGPVCEGREQRLARRVAPVERPTPTPAPAAMVASGTPAPSRLTAAEAAASTRSRLAAASRRSSRPPELLLIAVPGLLTRPMMAGVDVPTGLQ